ncbi:MAG TPA: hypothetical protein VH092_02025 [Urbifossiella sp.]|jgi:hypothetical protein|nr:hypothetical protein [Urbifossiella sp.]
MMRNGLLLALAVAAGAATGCGAGQAKPPANPLPPIQGKAPGLAATAGDAGPVKAPPRQ